MKTLLLQGYGVSIKVRDTRLVFTNGRDPRTDKQEIIELPTSACPFDKVVIQGKGYVALDAMQVLAESNINVIMLDKHGKLVGYFNQVRGSEPLVRQKQYDCFRDDARLEFLRKWLIKQKLESQIKLFNEVVAGGCGHVIDNKLIEAKFKACIVSMQQSLFALDKAGNYLAILGIESTVAKMYYPTLMLVFNQELRFKTRNNFRTFRPNNASDVINGLLNYGFAILYTEITKQLNALGLDCTVGFYHKSHPAHLPLVYDMIEPFRHLVDRSILQIQFDVRRRDYAYARSGTVVLSNQLKRKYIDVLTGILDRKRDYKARCGPRRSDGNQKMEEITIMKMKCIELRDYISGQRRPAVQIRLP